MSEALILSGTVLAGALLGAFFYGGLWWTILTPSRWSGLLFCGSFLLRMVCAVAGFYFVARGDWRRLVACLVGFLLARIVITQFLRLPADSRFMVIEVGRQ